MFYIECIYNNYFEFELKNDIYNLIKNLINNNKLNYLNVYSGDLYIIQLKENVVFNINLYKIGMSNRTIEPLS